MNKKQLLILSMISLSTLAFALGYGVGNFNSTKYSKPALMNYNDPILNDDAQQVSALVGDSLDKKVIYLTFDDGPNPNWTPKVLEILKANQVKATFFVVGTNVEKYPNLLHQEVLDGDGIGNHTYNHIYKDIYASPENYLNSIRKNDALLRSMGVVTYISRTPAGHLVSPVVYAGLKKMHIRNINWNLANGDGFTTIRNENFLVQTAETRYSHMKIKHHVILLMHDGVAGIDPNSDMYAQMSVTRYEDLKALPVIIKFFKDRGYTFEVLK